MYNTANAPAHDVPPNTHTVAHTLARQRGSGSERAGAQALILYAAPRRSAAGTSTAQHTPELYEHEEATKTGRQRRRLDAYPQKFLTAGRISISSSHGRTEARAFASADAKQMRR
eukprot:scaffold25487_cov232-Isochrysis_galbana.AAC.1